MVVKADLHNHLTEDIGTPRSDLHFNGVIDFASYQLGKGGIFSLTNFNGIDSIDRRYEKFSQLKGYERLNLGNTIYVPEKDILVVKAQEIKVKQGHLLLLGVKENKTLRSGSNISLDDALKEAEDNNAIIIADHPFFLEGLGNFLKQNPRYLSRLDGFEVHNGEAALWVPFIKETYNANEKAKKFFDSEIKDKYNVGALYSSDGHSLKELGTSWMEILMPDISNSEKLISSLRKEIHKVPKEYHEHNSIIPALRHAVKTQINSGKR